MILTPYEELYKIWEFLFPTTIIVEFEHLFQVGTILITIIVMFGIVFMPLWRLIMYMVRGGKR
jgi:Zn-dependent membrane protease YugP